MDESMHKYTVSFSVDGGDTKGKTVIMVVSTNNPGPTFNNWEAGMLLTMVLAVRIALAGVVIPYGSMVLILGVTLVDTVSPYG